MNQGPGKSTIGKAVVGLVPIAEGNLELNGYPLNPTKRQDQKVMRREVTMVFQDPASSAQPSPNHRRSGFGSTELARHRTQCQEASKDLAGLFRTSAT